MNLVGHAIKELIGTEPAPVSETKDGFKVMVDHTIKQPVLFVNPTQWMEMSNDRMFGELGDCVSVNLWDLVEVG